MSSRCARLRSLTWSQRAVLVEASLQLPFTVLALRLRGLRALGPDAFRAFAQSRARGRRTPAPGPESEARASEITAIVEMALRHGVVRPNCLQRSVTLWRILRRHGIESEVRIGVRRAPGEPAPSFHAWIERNGVVLNDWPGVTRAFATFGRESAGGEP